MWEELLWLRWPRGTRKAGQEGGPPARAVRGDQEWKRGQGTGWTAVSQPRMALGGWNLGNVVQSLKGIMPGERPRSPESGWWRGMWEVRAEDRRQKWGFGPGSQLRRVTGQGGSSVG